MHKTAISHICAPSRRTTAIQLLATPFHLTKPRAGTVLAGLLFSMVMLTGSDVRAQTVVLGPTPSAPVSLQSVKAVLVQHKVAKNDKGEEVFEDASHVRPNDVIEYKVTYTNDTAKPITNLVALLPIPPGLDYQASSAKPNNNVTFATANAEFHAEPLLQVVDKQTVPYADYRQIRWKLNQLPPHGVAIVSARMRVETVVPPNPPVVSDASSESHITGLTGR